MFTTGAYNLNIIGVRSANRVANSFDDKLHLVYKAEDGKWIERVWQITTDPGTYWLSNPENLDGTAILVPGQYRGVYGIGLHRGQYEALTQQFGEVAVYRDNDGDNILDPTKGPFKGYFGINIHKAGTSSTQVDKWSAGCQVFAKNADFAEFLAICKIAAAKWGPKFTYTLLGD